jgi:serine/threonine protein kinase
MAAQCPDAFIDPVTFEVMQDPVLTVDGHSFERAAVENWFRDHNTSPLTGAVLTSTAITPNITLKKAIEEWRVTQCKEIPRQALELHEEIGAGSFKRVYRATFTLPGVRPSTVAALKVHTGNVSAEVETLLRLSLHPRLISLLGVCKEGAFETILLTQFAPLGDLKRYLEEIEADITVAHRLTITQQICSGMEALTQARLIHRDLALRNILVFAYDSSDFTRTSVKISDFGLTVNAYTATMRYVAGGPKPVRYLAPEALEKERYFFLLFTDVPACVSIS